MSRKFTLKYLLFLLFVAIAGTSNAQLVTIGTGTSITSTAPINSGANYSYTQQIYTPTEILAANGGVVPNGQIINVQFNLSTSSFNSTFSGSNTWTIYMGNTATATFPNTTVTSWVPSTAMTQVFSGTVTFPAFGNWMTIPLTVPFNWDGVSNIVVAVNETNSGSDCCMYWTASSTNPNYRTLYYYNYGGSSSVDVTAPPVASGRVTTRPNVRFQWAQSCSVTTGFPTTGSVAVSPGDLCVSGNVTLSFTPAATMPAATGVTYKWQSCPTATGTFVDIPGAITTNPTYTTTTPISSTTYFKCVVLCNSSSTILTSSASNGVTITNPGTVTTTGASRCGPGTVALSATPSVSGNALHWYTTATGGAPIGTGSPFTTPYVPSTTTFYAASEVNTPVSGTIGTATTTVPTYTYPTAFGNYWYQTWSQMVYTVAELQAAGLSAGSISAATFKILSQPSPNTNPTTYSIWMGPTTNSTLSAFTTTGLTQVYSSASQSSVVGNNTLTFTTPYIWDGVSNIILDIRQTESYGNGNAATYYTNTTGNTVVYGYTSSNNPNFWTSNPTAYTSTQRLNVTFAGTGTCSNARVPAVATINASPAITITRPNITCSNEIGHIQATSTPMSNYTNYSWAANVTDLYSNAAGTTPYVSGSSPSVYLNSTTSGTHTFYLFSSGATPAACTHADTITVFVQPDSITITGAPDTVCVSGPSTLTLVPDTGYAPNSIQWQESATGSNYLNIAGATSSSYTTPVLTSDHYYRALIKSTNDTCEMPVKHIVVSDPQLVGAQDGFTCGPGTVNLTAQSLGNSTIRWYTTPTGGNSVGEGSPFTTPYLGASQIYYVDAEGGLSVPNIVQDGTDNSTDGGSNYDVGPFSEANQGFVMQFLYTAAEINAAGGTAGIINSLAFNCTNPPSFPIPNYRIQMKTVPSSMNVLSVWQTGLTDVYLNPSLTVPASGWVTFPFSAGVLWNGTDNIVVQVCWDLVSNYSYNGDHEYTSVSGRFLYNYNYSGSSCGLTGSYTSNSLPNARFGIRTTCQSARTAVNANVYPKPVVDLGPDINYCIDANSAIILNAGVQPNGPSYRWNDNTTSQILQVTESGTYYVAVTNMYTCVGSDTINVTVRHNPIINLGADTTVCNGVNLELDPHSVGVEYFWSTGQTDETIDVNSPGSYSVFVTNADGCTSSDTIQVTMQGELPSIQGVQITNNGQYSFQFTAVNPQNVIGYDWDFGDGSPHSYLANPAHTYADNGNYIVVLNLSSTCGFLIDTTSAHIVGIHQINVSNDQLSVYPNPSKDIATIAVNGELKMEKIEVYNVLGQIIYKKNADSNTKHTLNLGAFASGMYTIQVYTDKGTVARKLEIIK